jgi:hypothetical protein
VRSFPLLADFLTLTMWPDGSSRALGTALAFVEGDTVKVCLNDKDAGLVCFVSAPTWEQAWLAAEGALEEGRGDWRASKRQEGTQRRPRSG